MLMLGMFDGFHSAHTHCEAELSTILTYLMLVCDPMFPHPSAHY